MSSGVFASWQPRYAEHGIPTFPVRFDGADKKPHTRGYLKVGSTGSHQLARKFPTADAFGFALGTRTGITVLDIDTTSERTRDEAFDRHGEPAIIVRSLRGRWQGWYRHQDERRHVRPWGPAKPIDVLGNGFVVAPPSEGPRGRYEFVQGGLEDLDRLKPLRGLELPSKAAQAGGALVREGARHKTVLRYCQEQARHCDDLKTLVDVARTYAEANLDMLGTTHRFTDAEIIDAASWAWAIEAKGLNLVGRGGATVVRHDVVDRIAASDPDAFALHTILWRNHSDRREFIVANAMAETLAWDVRRFKRTRSRLCEYDLIKCVHRGGNRPGDPPRFRWKDS
jgi:Bifunctional DNA primase/polymerase, N-terminal